MRKTCDTYNKLNVDPIKITQVTEVWGRPTTGFYFEGEAYCLDDVIRIRNNMWVSKEFADNCPDYIHGYIGPSYFPIFVEVFDDGEYVNLYDYIQEEVEDD